MIGFSNLGDINNHLIDFEQSISSPPASKSISTPQQSPSLPIFMVRGLFNKLQFVYVQFPALDLSGDLLHEPFWEAVGRIEKCGLKVIIWFHNKPTRYNYHECLHYQVLGATMDGASINCCMVKLHRAEKGK